MSVMKSSYAFLQNIGKSLMLPVAVLPIAGLLLGVGSAHFGWMPALLSNVMAQAGNSIFSNLPLIFAVGTVLGLTSNDGVAALAAVVGYVVMLATMGVFAQAFGVTPKAIMGIDSLDTGVFGGIWIGIVAAYLFKRFYRIELPPYLGFFSGKRSVPILTAFAAVISGALLSVIWPPIGHVINGFSHWAAAGNPAAAFSLYGFVERLLLPFGLHHIWNVPFFFEAGTYTDPKTGKILTGEIARYIGGDPTAGNLAGGYLFKMWGLPAAALAIWHRARPESRKKVGGIMISAALTSFLTGITEPIEFSFLFLAPVLYGLHAVICAAAYFLCITLGIKHGMTFSHGFIDFVLFYPQSTRALWFFVIGPAWALMYFFVFDFAIARFNLKTPGRELEVEGDAAATSAATGPGDSKAEKMVNAFGGASNIRGLDACITRVRVLVGDQKQVNADALKAMGATAVLQMGDGVQAIFGTASENLKTDMERFLQSGGAKLKQADANESQKWAQQAAKEDLGSAGLSASGAAGAGAAAPALNLEFAKIAAALGGAANIASAQGIALTRVRVELRDAKLLRKSDLAQAGVKDVQEIKPGLLHLIFGRGLGDGGAALAAKLTTA